MNQNETPKERPDIPESIVQALQAQYSGPEDIDGPNGLIGQLRRRLLEGILEGELTEHLGYEKHSTSGNNSGNSRNGKTSKRVVFADGEAQVQIPRDRNGTFEPRVIPKREMRFAGFDDSILSLYARGMTTRDIRAHLKKLYGVEVSKDFISTVTDSILEEVKDWRNRELFSLYPIVIMDAMRVKIRDHGRIRNKALYLAIGINSEGQRDILGIWIAQEEGASFWLGVLTELKNRGIQDILIACVDGLKGFPDAIEAIFPQTHVQLCVVHMARQSLRYVNYKHRRDLAKDLRSMYTAPTEEKAEQELCALETKWNTESKYIAKVWRENWSGISHHFQYSVEVRHLIYTTNAIEAANRSVRKSLKNRVQFPHDEAAFKMVYLAIQNLLEGNGYTQPVKGWSRAMAHLKIIFKERMDQAV